MKLSVILFVFSFYRYWFRSYLNITLGSAKLEILIKNNTKKQKQKQKLWADFF